MSSRVPPSNNPNNPTQAPPTERPRRSTRAQADDTPKLIWGRAPQEEKALSPEAKLWGGQDMDRSLEIRASEIEQRLAELAQAEQSEQEAGPEHNADVRKGPEAAEKKGFFKGFSWQKKNAPSNPPDNKTALQKQQEAKQEALKTRPALKISVGRPNLTGVSASRLQAVSSVGPQALQNERPPDAFSLLKQAREKGVLFVEDALADGHSEDNEDPEHAAAVEECIAQCFGVRGILRIGPGHNDKNEPIIVVATTHGFTDASLGRVPEKVNRFATLVAIPFDLLPLKRER